MLPPRVASLGLVGAALVRTILLLARLNRFAIAHSRDQAVRIGAVHANAINAVLLDAEANVA